MKKEYVEIIAPFSGFYETIHSGNIESTARIYYTDDDDNEIKEDNTDYRKTYIEYCKKWVNNLLSKIKDNKFIKDIDIKFNNLDSPKYYNYTTDRLFMKIDTISIQKIQDLVIKDYSEELELELKKRFTSCDGFASFYPNNTKEFLLHKQDHNTRTVYFEIFLENVLEIDSETLSNLVEEVEIIFNKQ